MLSNEANLRILQLLSETEGPITLGLLPISVEEQENCITNVITSCGGSFSRLIDMLGVLSPAATAYAIAAGASQAVVEGKRFWEPISERFGIELKNATERERLSKVFRSACRRLGVVEPDVSVMNWVHIAPMMAQASILHRWVPSLAAGVTSTLNYRPLPDLQDAEALHKFACDLADQIRSQPNLCNILRTEVGGIVVHRLISSCIYGRFDTLPPHLRIPMQEAFGAGKQVPLKSPYVSFNVFTADFELVFPKQPPSLVRHNTYWQVGTAQYPAQAEQRLSEFEIGKGAHQVRLRNLNRDYQDQSFDLDLSMRQPFRVFDQQNLRERSVAIGKETLLPPGEYLIVMSLDCTTDESESERIIGDYRVLSDLTLRPGLDPLQIKHPDGESHLAPALKAGIYHSADEGDSVPLEDGSRLHFGTNFGFLAFIPKDQHEGHLSIGISSRDKAILEKEEDLKSSGERDYDYSGQLEVALREVIDFHLTSGIHPLKVRVATGATAVTRTLWFWKGLEQISRHSGFKCSSKPGNIDFSQSKGIQSVGNDCKLIANYHSPRVVIALSENEKLIFLRPGVRAACVAQGENEQVDLNGGESLTVGDHDGRVVEFESGGFEQWTLYCNGQKFATLDKHRTRFQIGLRTLVAQNGKSGQVEARSDFGDSIRLFGFAAGLTGEKLELEEDHGRGFEKWTTTLPCEDLGRLGLRILDYSQSPDPVESAVTHLFTQGQVTEDGEIEIQSADGVSSLVRFLPAEGGQADRVSLSIHVSPEKTDRNLLFIELLNAPVEAEVWQSLQCADGPTTSRLCIVARGQAVCEPGISTWWHHLWRVGTKTIESDVVLSLYAEFDETTVAKALKQISHLLAVKYPSKAYAHSARFLAPLAHRLSKRREQAGKRDTNAWWREGALELRSHAEAKVTPVVRQFLFTCNIQSLRRHWSEAADSHSAGRGIIFSSLGLGNSVRLAGGRVGYAQSFYHENRHPSELYSSFGNFSTVINGQAADFAGFDYTSFFKPIFTRLEQHEECATLLDDSPILSARHLLSAVHAVNRRSRILSNASRAEAGHPLQAALQALTTNHRKCEQTILYLNQRIGFKPWQKLSSHDRYDHFDISKFPTPPLLANTQACHLNDLTWTLCVLVRGSAHGRLSPEEFDKILTDYVSENLVGHPFNLVFSFAPELFAYYTALLDFTLFNSTANHD